MPCSQFSTCRPDLFVLARGTKVAVHQHSVLIAAKYRLFGCLSDSVRRRGKRDADIRLLIDRHASFRVLIDLRASFQSLRLLCMPRPLRKSKKENWCQALDVLKPRKPSQLSTCRPDLLVFARGTKAVVHQHPVLIAAECRFFGRLIDDVRRRGERDAGIRLLIDRHVSFQRPRLLCCKPHSLRKQNVVLKLCYDIRR